MFPASPLDYTHQSVDVDRAGPVDEVAALPGVVVRQWYRNAIRRVCFLELCEVFGAGKWGLRVFVVCGRKSKFMLEVAMSCGDVPTWTAIRLPPAEIWLGTDCRGMINLRTQNGERYRRIQERRTSSIILCTYGIQLSSMSVAFVRSSLVVSDVDHSASPPAVVSALM